jgi:hypothetical protein
VDAADANDKAHRVVGDLVKESKTAIAIATAIASETYGSEMVQDQVPLIARRTGGTWHIKGSMPPNEPGGVMEVWISATDGQVIRMTHGR